MADGSDGTETEGAEAAVIGKAISGWGRTVRLCVVLLTAGVVAGGPSMLGPSDDPPAPACSVTVHR